jgi:Ca-activated chloride channel family protein
VSTGCQGSLWARGRLRYLEDLYASRNRDLPVEGLENQMVELSTAFGVLCRFTAVVAIDPRHPDRKPEPASLRRIVQPVDMIVGMRVAHAFRAPTGHHRHAPGIAMYLSCNFSCESPADPLKDVLMHALEILARARPKSGAIGDVKPAKVRNLLKAVLALLRELGACGAPRESIESVATAYGRLYAMPNDQAAIVAVLEAIADIAELSAPPDRWWRAAPVDTSAYDDVPF